MQAQRAVEVEKWPAENVGGLPKFMREIEDKEADGRRAEDERKLENERTRKEWIETLKKELQSFTQLPILTFTQLPCRSGLRL